MHQLLEKKQVVYLILILLGISRLVFLNADPSIFRSAEDISDEFWWASAALIKNNTDHYPTEYLSGALAVGPVYSFIMTFWFKILGSELFSLRILSWLTSVISTFVLYHLFKPSHKTFAAITAFGLSFLHMFHAYSRIAQIEMLQLSVFLVVLLILKNNKYLWIAGFLTAIGVLLKASFIIMIPALFTFILLQRNKENLKELILFSSGFALLILPAIFFFFIPHYQSFQPYFQAFSNISFPLNVLLHPLGIPFRLIFFPEHLIFHDPTIALLIILVLIRFNKKLFTENKEKTENKTFESLMIISALYFFFLLFTDFNERRMVLLMPAFVSLLFIPYQIKESLQPKLFLVIFYLFSLPMIIHLKSYFGSLVTFSVFHEFINGYAFWMLLHLLFFILFAFFYIKNELAFKRVAPFLLIFIFSVWIMLLISRNYFYWGLISFPSLSVQIIVFSILIVLGLLYFKFNKSQILKYAWLFFAVFIQIVSMWNTTYSIEKMSKDFNTRFDEVNYISGDNSIFIAAFPYPEKVLPFTGSFKDNSEALVKQFNTFKPEVYLSAKKHGSNAIEFKENMEAIENEIGCSFEPVWMYELLPKSLAYKTDLLVFRIIYQKK